MARARFLPVAGRMGLVLDCLREGPLPAADIAARAGLREEDVRDVVAAALRRCYIKRVGVVREPRNPARVYALRTVRRT